MHLEHIIIFNFRSCKKVHISFAANEPNVIVGINDSGKTTILKAIDALFNDKFQFSYVSDNNAKQDISNTPLASNELNQVLSEYELPSLEYNNNTSYIIGKVSYEENELSDEIKSELSNNCLWSLDTQNYSCLWILKEFNNETKQSKTKILTADSTYEGEPIRAFTLTQVNLNRLIKKLDIEEDVVNENNSGPLKNIEKVKAIYQKVETYKVWHEMKFEKEDKKHLLPIFRYLDWHCSLDEIKKIAADALSAIFEEQINPLRNQISQVKSQTQQLINQKLTEVQSIIGADFPNITALKTNVHIDIQQSITDIIINKSNTDGDIHLDNQGEGVKRQIWFSLLKLASQELPGEERVFKKYIWAFDEPETHLYPTAQRQLFEIISSISKRNVQTVLSTHSTIFINKIHLSSILSTHLNREGYTDYCYCNSISDIYEALEMQNSDFLFYNKFLIIEGDTEFTLIPKLYKLYKGRSVEEDNIKVINIKGKDKWIESKSIIERIFTDFKKTDDILIYLFDNDQRYAIGQQSISENMFFAGSQDIEDSIDNNCWLAIISNQGIDGLSISHDEIQALKDRVPKDRVGQKNEKFYMQLQQLLKEKKSNLIGETITYNILPDKGIDSANLIFTHIQDIQQVCPQIRAAFDMLTPNITLN